MIEYYKKIVLQKAIEIMESGESFLTCDVINQVCYELEICKEYREHILQEWQTYCHTEPWFNIDDIRFSVDKIGKLKQFSEYLNNK